MGDPHYALEKFRQALSRMTIGPGQVRRRLGSAFLIYHVVQQDDLPEHLREDFVWIWEQMTKFGPVRGRNGEVWKGAVDNTMQRIRNSTGVKIAERLQRLERDLSAYLNE